MARELAMSRGQRLGLGDRLEAVKAAGGGGSKNARGDFTMRELRAEARESRRADGPAIEPAVARSASFAAAERSLDALAGAELRQARFTPADELDLTFGDAAPHPRLREGARASRGWTLRLRAAPWTLVSDEEPVARSRDEPAHVLECFDALDGRVVAEALLRRRDAAMTLNLEDELGGERVALVVRGRPGRRERATLWELSTPEGLLVVAYGDRAISVGPDEPAGSGCR